MDYAVRNIYGKINNKKASVSVPASKSIAARAVLIAALAEGESTLTGARFSEDCQTVVNCLKALGIPVEIRSDTVKITGCGGKLPLNYAEINVGSAGTAARFLPALLAFQNGKFKVDCSEQMKRRPVEPLIKSLERLGAKFFFLEKKNAFPFIIDGAKNVSDEIEIDINQSSQFLSALLISSVCAGKTMKIKALGNHGIDYVNITLNIMKSFGAEISEDSGIYSVYGGYTAQNYIIEPDVSAACYFYAANKILGSDISVKDMPAETSQGDLKFINLLKTFNGGTINMRDFSDQALTLAAISPYLEQPTEIYGIAHVRGQECDRIKAIVYNLNLMGVKCEERADGVKIYPSQPKPANIETFGDHRVAMSFALTGLRADGIVIKNAEVCSKTFKDYFSVLDEVCTKLTL